MVDAEGCQLNAVAETRATFFILFDAFHTPTHPPMKPFMTPIPSLFLSRATSELNAVPNLCKLCSKNALQIFIVENHEEKVSNLVLFPSVRASSTTGYKDTASYQQYGLVQIR